MLQSAPFKFHPGNCRILKNACQIYLCKRNNFYCTEAKTTNRRGYVVTCTTPQNGDVSSGCSRLWDDYGVDVLEAVKTAAHPRRPGQTLLLPGGLGRDPDGCVRDLCVLGVPPAGSSAFEESSLPGADPPADWEIADDLRDGVRSAVTRLKELGCSQILVDVVGNDCLTAEAAVGATFAYPTHRGRRKPPSAPTPTTRVWPMGGDSLDWRFGTALGAAELRARRLMERPANLCTPIWFCSQAIESVANLPGVTCEVLDESRLSQEGMSGLLAVSAGSIQPPRLLVARYEGRASGGVDACLVGKGVTFDSGGISIKPAAKMADMRADMGGAAVAFSVFLAACRLRLSVDLGLVVPLCENLPDGRAVKPGDVVEMRSGLTVRVDNTDAEGRLLLADALHFSCERMRPNVIVDVATLTGAVAVALGHSRAGLFANASASKHVRMLLGCGFRRGDPLHLLPVDRHYRSIVKDSSGLADLSNVGSTDRMAGACTAAAFLSHFVPANTPWMHIDMAGVMQIGERMSGRPTRALLQFISDLSLNDSR